MILVHAALIGRITALNGGADRPGLWSADRSVSRWWRAYVSPVFDSIPHTFLIFISAVSSRGETKGDARLGIPGQRCKGRRDDPNGAAHGRPGSQLLIKVLKVLVAVD